MDVLRAGARVKSHHFSTWRSGMFLGLALPVLVSGLYLSEFLHFVFGSSSNLVLW